MLQSLEGEVEGLRTTVKDLNQQLETSRVLQSRNNSQLSSVHHQLSVKLSEIKTLQDQLAGLFTS
jgi:DNA repair exonuclease SbcCD ATPase subunit